MTTKQKVSKMEALGFRNTFADKENSGKKSIQFRTMRGHRLAKTKDGEWEIDRRVYDLTFSIPGVDSIIIPVLDENGQTVKDGNGQIKQQEARIAYVPGAQSIFVEEIMDYMGFREHKEVLEIAEPINFFNERLDCEPHEINKVAFLRATNLCLDTKEHLRKGNPIYYEYDPVHISEERVKRHLANSEAMRVVEDLIAKDSKVTLWAMFSERRDLTISQAKERYSYSEVKDMVLGFAKENPVDFMRTMKDPKRMDRIYILQALNDGVLRENPDGSVKNSKGETVAIVGRNANTVDAVYSQISTNAPEHLRDLRVTMSKEFEVMSEQQHNESEEIRKLKEQLKKLESYKEIADSVDPDKLKQVVGKSVTVEQVKKTIEGVVASGKLKMSIGRWLKDAEGGSLLPPKEANNDKTWCVDTLPQYYVDNPGEYQDLLERL